MRHPRVPSIVLVAAVTAALAPTTVMAQTSAEILAQAQPPAPSPAQQAPALPPAPAPGPYKPVAITLPAPLNDPSFDAFRKQLAALAHKKDRAALAPLVAASFFWVPEDADLADKKKSGIDNLAKALGLEHEIGSLEVGKAADIAAFDLSGAGYSETPDPETLLVYSGSGRDLRHLWVSGEQLVNDRQLTRKPYATIRREYSATYQYFWDRVAAAKKTNNTKVA